MKTRLDKVLQAASQAKQPTSAFVEKLAVISLMVINRHFSHGDKTAFMRSRRRSN
ncbi:hypothetical protein [Mycolicibacterium moriokaense]|uniref:hypothetical protein n=1 Tax=Mycolicibacterium moriokaense TaxID=39691 RepID=UPI0015E88D5A|nr:hypothetical protein [Mycolicibacterium moriokaense]